MLTNDCLVLMTVLDQGGPREPSRLTDHITWRLVDLKKIFSRRLGPRWDIMIIETNKTIETKQLKNREAELTLG